MPNSTAVKTRHRVTPWREYDHALVERGSLTIWFQKETVLLIDPFRAVIGKPVPG